MSDPQGQQSQTPRDPAGHGAPARQSIHSATADIQAIIDTAERAAASIRAEAEDQARRYLEDARRRADSVAADRVRTISELTDDLMQQANVVKGHSERMIAALEDAIRLIGERLDADEKASASALGASSAWPEPEPIPPPSYEVGPSYDPSLYERTATDPVWEGSPTRGEREETAAFPPPPPPPPPPPEPGETAETAGPGPDRAPEEPAPPGEEPEAAPPAEPAVSPSPGPSLADPPEEALIKATQLAVAGTERDQIAAVLREEFGLGDPGPVLDRIMGPSA